MQECLLSITLHAAPSYPFLFIFIFLEFLVIYALLNGWKQFSQIMCLSVEHQNTNKEIRKSGRFKISGNQENLNVSGNVRRKFEISGLLHPCTSYNTYIKQTPRQYKL